MYYVYAYLRQSDLTPYYIGKGKGDRIHKSHGSLKLPKDRRLRVILEGNLTEVGAFALERFYIRWYGRQDKDLGILLNRTDGGDGVSGWKCSEETKRKIGLANKNKPSPLKGRNHTDAAREKISQSKIGRTFDKLKKVYEITHPDNTTEIITGLDQWCKKNNMHTGNMSSVASGHLKHYKHFKCKQLNF